MIMKKLLLMLVAFVATMTASAQDHKGWMKQIQPVADKADLAGLHTAVAGDGSVYASTTYDKVFEFAGKNITDSEGLLSSCIVKYDANGEEKWAISLVGACTINAMAVEGDGTLYVAGKTTDEKVVVTSTDNTQTEINNPTAYNILADAEMVSGYSAFVAKINADGVLQALKVVSPTSAIPVDLMCFDPCAITPTKLVIDGDKVYVSCAFGGNVAELGWEGSYLSMDGWMGQDLKSYGLFSLAKADLSGLTSVAKVQREPLVATYLEGAQEDVQNTPDAFNFGLYNGTPVMTFIGWGDLKLTAGGVSKVFSFAVANDGTGMNEHGMVCTNGSADRSTVFHAEKHEKSYVPYNLIGGEFVNGNCIFGGTFYGNFPLDNTVTKDKNTSFVASIDMATCGVNWAMVNNVESEATCMIVTSEEVHAATTDAKYTLDTTTGELKDVDAQGFKDAAHFSDQYVSVIFTENDKVWVFSPKMNPSAISNTKVQQNGAAKYYNLNGVELNAPQKGLNIVKTAEGTHTVVIK